MGKRLFETKDGYKISVIESLVEYLGAEVKGGGRHKKVFSFPGTGMMPCALGESTNFEDQVANVIARFSDYSKEQICHALRGINKPHKVYRALASYA